MSEKRRGLGRGLGALIPSSPAAGAASANAVSSRPVDLFFPEARKAPAVSAADAVKLDSAAVVKQAGVKSGNGKTPATAAPAKSAARKSAAVKAPATKVGAVKTPGQAGAVVPDTVSAPQVELVEVPGARFAEISVTDIHPNRKQPRSIFDEDDMAELVHSVKEIGVLQPIVVRTSTEKGGEPYELVMGERRWRAVQAAGFDTIPAIVRDTTDDDLLRDALLENLHRSQLNPLEEAAAYQQLLEDFGTTHEQLADRIGRSRPQVTNTLRLLKLPPLVQRRVAANVLSAGHARALLALPDAAAMERLAQKIVAEGMSVRATEEAVTLYQDPVAPAKNSIPRPNARHERLDYLASSLSDRLDTNVKITLGARKGRVSIEFASVEDLNRIMDVLSPGAES
ncbi:ParB/RepB/Spo0J family partition protein [Arthrobacter cavernae]|uniref:ParB/RepB/Spo0J family partition protein n=1 Tax=Arthrobacter cavernae TaxID=2817681 RepID=A0A939HI90_9MICC|nr:ParB/RepB/Spo0J family partition protein [Arthrobacter cavernae]MBO1267950.1 ParB/RepB/Spo0J family partition protein [Arthrobacter cavernae]